MEHVKHKANIKTILSVLHMYTGEDICFKNLLQPVGVKHLWVKGCCSGFTV